MDPGELCSTQSLAAWDARIVASGDGGEEIRDILGNRLHTDQSEDLNAT